MCSENFELGFSNENKIEKIKFKVYFFICGENTPFSKT